MKITKEQLRKIIKEELKEAYVDVVQSPDYERNLARDAARPPDPIGPQEAHALAKALEGLGFAFTRGGMYKLEDFLAELEASEDLRRT